MIRGWGTKIPQAVWCGQKENKLKKKKEEEIGDAGREAERTPLPVQKTSQIGGNTCQTQTSRLWLCTLPLLFNCVAVFFLLKVLMV